MSDDKSARKSLEEFLIDAMTRGEDLRLYAPIIKMLPADKQDHYRALWLKMKKERESK